MPAQEAQGNPSLRLIAIAEGELARSTKGNDLQSQFDFAHAGICNFMHVHRKYPTFACAQNGIPVPSFNDLVDCKQRIV
jgi:hypothetical protein